MSIFSNTSGLITRGFGEATKVLTRGFGGDKITKGLPPKVDIIKEYLFEIYLPVIKRGYFERNIFVPVKRIINKHFQLKSNVNKESLKSFNIKTKIDSKKLFLILDSI